MRNVIDLGSGTGILLVLAHHFKIGGERVAIDNVEEAVKCTEMNAKIYGFGEHIKVKKMDLTEVYLNKTLFDDKYESQ